jgi:hypothetical protein
MAYPEPIPVLKSKDAKEFDKRLSQFKLSKAQKQFYKKGLAAFKDDD